MTAMLADICISSVLRNSVDTRLPPLPPPDFGNLHLKQMDRVLMAIADASLQPFKGGIYPADLMWLSMFYRCLPDPIHVVPHHRWDATVLHGAGSGAVQPGRCSHGVEDLSFL